MRNLAICAYCDTVHRRTELSGRTTARCVTCDARLYHGGSDLGAMLAVTITAATGLIVANAFPLVTLTSGGRTMQATLAQAISVSYDRDLPFVAVVLAIALVIAPVLELGLLLWVLVPLCANTRPPAFASAMRWQRRLRPWRMVEVFLLGLVVGVVKLSAMADVAPDWGVFGVIVMTLALAALATVDHDVLWRRASELAA